MDRLTVVSASFAPSSQLTAWHEGGALWLFAGSLYRPSGWLRRDREHLGAAQADMLCYQLRSSIRCELLHHYASLCGPSSVHRIDDNPEHLASLFWRGRIQVFRLSASDHLMRLFDPSYHLFC